MKLHNVGMFVNDLDAAVNFFVDYFGAAIHYQEEDESGFREVILKFNDSADGAKLEIMTKPTVVDDKKDANRTGYAHICIRVDSREKLDEIIDKIHKAGYEVQYEPATNGGKEIRAITFEDNVIEVNC
ncbi:MAG: VOC family protein [Lachnospiraceae bacterium]|nr:VOC family protein [Lachnospiraceae bacterium]